MQGMQRMQHMQRMYVWMDDSEDEEEDFSKGAEDFVEAVKKRRIERQNNNGDNHFLWYMKVT